MAEATAADHADELEAWLLLAATPGIARALHRVVAAVGDPLALLQGLPPARLSALGLSPSARRWLRSPSRARVQPGLRWLAGGPHRRLLRFGEPAYPPLLARIADPPVALFVRGHPDSLSLPHLAIVGARGATPAALETASAFAAALSAGGFGIASGLAIGTDAAAHHGALAGGGVTTAVMATGPDTIYPREHSALAERIAARGALVTEFPPGTPPRRANFPLRNRIISGLSAGTLVVEAALHSGSLITARLAAEQGREVFAVPGSIHNPLTRGCHRLLRDGAVLVESVEDIVAALPSLLGGLVRAEPARTPCEGPPGSLPAVAEERWGADEMPSDTRLIANSLGHDPVSIDHLAQRSGLTSDRVSAMLLLLELRGMVHRQPDGRYCRAAPAGNRSR